MHTVPPHYILWLLCSEWTLSALTSQNKNGGISVGTFVNFVWVTIGEIFLSDHISAKEEDKQF